jgi:hypothetical protein
MAVNSCESRALWRIKFFPDLLVIGSLVRWFVDVVLWRALCRNFPIPGTSARMDGHLELFFLWKKLLWCGFLFLLFSAYRQPLFRSAMADVRDLLSVCRSEFSTQCRRLDRLRRLHCLRSSELTFMELH